MKLTRTLLIVGLLVLLSPLAPSADENEEAVYNYSFWIGSHYTDFKDYSKRVGEYNLGNSELLPELRLDLSALKGDGYYTLNGHYFDDQNILGSFSATKGNRLAAKLQFRSLIHQKGQDLLENMETRELVGANPGGKILTHELTDPNADYNTNRNEILTKINLLLSKRNNESMISSHRTEMEKGEDNRVSSTHCIRCHQTSQTMDVDKRTHQVEAGLEAEAGQFDFGYLFGYRKFNSEASNATIYYDSAAHPVSGGSGDEFASRVIYEDTTISYGIYPETEKMSHKVKFNGDVGRGRFASAFTYSKVENKGTALASNALAGVVNYAVPLSDKTRFVARLSVTKVTADDTQIDLPTWHPHDIPVDFDYTRYSSLDRTDARGTAEVITRLNRKTTLAVLAGYNRVERDDYPVPSSGFTTNKYIGQLKARYRQGLKFSGAIKYRFEKTSDPFTSGNGLFEARGREVLDPSWGFRSFYYQREDLRYQDITTLPTDYHKFEIKSTIRPDPKYSFIVGVRATYDKNGNLDSLDVKHLSVQPHLNLMVTPDPKWAVTTGYTYNYYKSRGPITVALFDG